MSSTETAQGTLCTPTKRPRESGTVLCSCQQSWCDLPHFHSSPSVLPSPPPSLVLPPFLASGSESEATPEKRPRPNEKEGGSEEAGGATPKQKNRRRCYRCQTKLELVQQELGSCRCGQYRCCLESDHRSVLVLALTLSHISSPDL